MPASITALWDGTNSTITAGMSYRDDGSTSHRPVGGQQFTISAPPTGTDFSGPAAEAVRTAVEAYNTMVGAIYSARNDPNLSDVGRRTKVEAPVRLALFTVSQVGVMLENFRKSIDAREAQLFALPALNLALPGAAIADWERRTWFFAQSEKVQHDALQYAISHPVGDGEMLIAALLRGPLPAINPRLQAINSLWQETRRAGNPTEAEAIDEQRESADWALGMVGMIASFVAQEASTWLGAQPLDVLMKQQPNLDPSGYRVFGFSDQAARASVRQAAMEAAV